MEPKPTKTQIDANDIIQIVNGMSEYVKARMAFEESADKAAKSIDELGKVIRSLGCSLE